MENPAIIYNCSYNGLSIIQELGSKGIPCIAIDAIFSVGAFSKYAKFKRCPNPLKNESAFIEFLYKLCASLPLKPVLFPTNDEWALVTARHKNRLSEVSFPCVSGYETTNNILSKDQFYRIGQDRDYMTPYTWHNKDILSINEKKFPIVAKAKYKSLPDEHSNYHINKALKKNRLIVLNNKKQLEDYVDRHSEIFSHLVFQEYIAGNSSNMFTVGIYADNKSEIRALFTGRKVRGYPADIGDNILGESHDLPDSIIENTKKIVREMSYTGIAEFEYKKDQHTDKFRLIEINPRPWSWIGITPYCGVNIPFIAYKSLLGQEMNFKKSEAATGSVKYVKIYQDFFNCLLRYRFHYKPWHLSYSEWGKSLAASKLVVAEYNKGDWSILFASIPYLLGKLITQRWY
jgi:D-aspartate ligase